MERSAMTDIQNKKLLQGIFAELEKGNGRPFVEAMADDFRWHMIGTTAWSGTYEGKRDVQRRLLRPLMAQFADRYTNTASRFVAEGEHVVVECRGSVTTRAGRPYCNTYCWVCRIEDGKLKELTEYMDTQLVAKVLEPPSAAPA
jgi:hypothetical protein